MIPPLTANIAAFIGDPKVALVHVTVSSAQWTPAGPAAGGVAYESGVITADVVEVFSGPGRPKRDDVMSIAGRRIANEQMRFRDGRDMWNSLEFENGLQMLFALQPPAGGSNHWTALAGWKLTGWNDPAVEGLRRCVEAARMPEAKRVEYLPALIGSPDGISRAYAVLNLRNPAVAPRPVNAQIIAKAFVGASATVRTQMVLEMCGRSYLMPELGPDAANVAVLGALLQALITDPDPQGRKMWAGHLAASIGAKLDADPAKDKELRARFAAAIKTPARERAAAALRAAADAAPADARLSKLAEAWGH